MDECLAQIVEIIGPLPPALSSKWPNFSRRITTDGTLRLFDQSSGYVPEHIPPLEHLVLQYQPPDATEADMILLGELLRAMLQYNPADRPTPEELLEFEWFKRGVEVVENTQAEVDDIPQQVKEKTNSDVQPSANALGVTEPDIGTHHRVEEVPKPVVQTATNASVVEESTVVFAPMETTPRPGELEAQDPPPLGKSHITTSAGLNTQYSNDCEAPSPSTPSAYFKRLLGITTREFRWLFRSRGKNKELS